MEYRTGFLSQVSRRCVAGNFKTQMGILHCSAVGANQLLINDSRAIESLKMKTLSADPINLPTRPLPEGDCHQ